MSRVFLTVLHMSAAAGFIVAVIALLRLALARAPKRITVWLWAIAAVRLLCPFAPESRLSLLPRAEAVSPGGMAAEVPQLAAGISALDRAVNPAAAVSPDTAGAAPAAGVLPLLAAVWLLGAALMLLYAAVVYLRVKRRVGTAVLQGGGICRSERVDSPFVLGVFRPRIYLPFALTGRDAEMAVAHERAHIRRGDCLWKPLGFLLLALHWFNPLLWLGYALFCRDLELACDEAVVCGMTAGERADYAQALLCCSVARRTAAMCPPAFGGVGVKQRVKQVLNYKKPVFWAVIAAIVAGIAAAVCLLTDPAGGAVRAFRAQALVYTDGRYSYVQYADAAPQYLLADNARLYMCADGAAPVLLGRLEDMPEKEAALTALFSGSAAGTWDGDTAAAVMQGNRRARQLCHAADGGEKLYILLEQTDGSVYLGYGYPADEGGAQSASVRWLYKLAAVSPSSVAGADTVE